MSSWHISLQSNRMAASKATKGTQICTTQYASYNTSTYTHPHTPTHIHIPPHIRPNTNTHPYTLTHIHTSTYPHIHPHTHATHIPTTFCNMRIHSYTNCVSTCKNTVTHYRHTQQIHGLTYGSGV